MNEKILINIGEFVAIAAVAACGVWGIIYYLYYAVRSQVLGETFWRGREDLNVVALTFDDGPSPDTEKILDVLRENNIKATFFLIGRETEKYPEIARRIAAEGHEVGNHSQSHKIFLFCTKGRTRHEIYEAQNAITNITGVAPQISRPPCGVRSKAYFEATRELKLSTVQWDVAGFDWKYKSPRQIADAVLKKVKSGSIILLHDGDSAGKDNRRATAEAIPLILKGLTEKGLQVAPLQRLLANSASKEFKFAITKQPLKMEDNES